MKDYNGKNLLKQLNSAYRIITAIRRGERGTPELSSLIAENEHQIRTCCFTIRALRKEWKRCSVSEYGTLSILESARDFCELSDYRVQTAALKAFLTRMGKTDLSYSEIACLVPAVEYCCLMRIAGMTVEGNGGEFSAVRSLSCLTAYPGDRLVAELSQTERLLEKDPIFPRLDEDSKGEYRARISALARRKRKSERETALDLLRKSAQTPEGQIGALLFPQRKIGWYFPVLFVLYALISAGVFLIADVPVWLVSLIPVFCGTKRIADGFLSKVVRPRRSVKIKIEKGTCPPAAVTVVSLIKNERDVKKLLHRLDVLSAQVFIPEVSFGLLLDLPAAKKEETPEDEALLHLLQTEILSRGTRFFCAVRKRVLDPENYLYSAKGRKQGALIDFCDLLNGNHDAFRLVVGTLPDAQYLLPLDEDTFPAPGSIEGLIGFMEHPNHRAQLQMDRNGNWYVSSGYGAAMPQIEANPITSFRTRYAALLAGNAGSETYRNPRFHLYQDLFSEGIFCGKGILRTDAYRKIALRFRDDPVLSHDLPEGELLRCAAVTDLTFFDDVPDDPVSDLKRRGRWLRGDVQNLPYLKLKTTTHLRWKILDNLLRGAEDPLLFLLFVFGAFGNAPALLLAVLLIILPVLQTLPALFGSFFYFRTVFRPFAGCYQALQESVLHLLFLPASAVTAVKAFALGLIRVITGKKKLEWTTAAQSSGATKTVGDYCFRLCWQEVGFLFLFTPTLYLLGALWLLAPAAAYVLSHPDEKEIADEGQMRVRLRKMWNYYADFTTEQHHFLPPDNYQQEPLNCAAPRTSPTNIGFYLLCAVFARKLEFITDEELQTRLDDTLTVLEILPKWNGHLYNWYDTESLKALPPRFVSSVDCGNFTVCLYTAANVLKENDEPAYRPFVKRIRTLLSAADLKDFYDGQKDLFTLGVFAEDGCRSESCYDLYASEARLTSFYAIMTGTVPVRHWQRLARPGEKRSTQLNVGAWSGTMFEYFMPLLFLPCYPRSFCASMYDGVIDRQMSAAGKTLPWGISESGYYAFDRGLNYQYRAFGIAGLALRRDLDFPAVISAYSSFLAYPLFPRLAERNLRRLPEGKYGFYEAVDYRKGSDNPRVVCSYMAHHLGMSFLSGVNVLCDNAVQKAFMKDRGEAFAALLAEKVAGLSPNYYPRAAAQRTEDQTTSVESDRPDPEVPRTVLLCNERITELLNDSGIGVLCRGDRDLTAYSSDPDNPCGIWAFVRHAGKTVGATYAPLYRDKTAYRTLFDEGGATYYSDAGVFETRLSVSLPPALPVSVRELTVKNNRMTEGTFEFFFTLSPAVCQRRRYAAHPEYQDLFLTCEYDDEYRVVSFCRKTDGEEHWFCAAASAPFRFDVRRDAFAGYETVDQCLCRGAETYPLHPALSLRGTLEIRGRGTGSVLFYLSYGESRREAFDAIRRAAALPADTVRRKFAQANAAYRESIGFSAEDGVLSDYLLSRCFFDVKSKLSSKIKNELPRTTLWKYGISGDYPMISLRVGEDTAGRVRSFLHVAQQLSRAGVPVDFIFLYREKEAYLTPVRTALQAAFDTAEPEVQKRLHAVNLPSLEEYALFQKCSAVFINLERGWRIPRQRKEFRPLFALPPAAPSQVRISLPLGRGGFTGSGSYYIPKNKSESLRPWSLVLANRRFGTVINERSLGWSFFGSAAENPITVRIPGYSHAVSGEPFYLLKKGARLDLLRRADVEFFPEKAIFRIRTEELNMTAEVFIPETIPAKILHVRVKNTSSSPAELVYAPKIMMGHNACGTVNRSGAADAVYFTNPYHPSAKNTCVCLCGKNVRCEGSELHGSVPAGETCVLDYILICAGSVKSAERYKTLLLRGDNAEKELKRLDEKKNDVLIETPDPELDRLFNTFLPHQILNSRIFARTGPCQPGGAYGFRDQLQDAICLSLTRPELLKRQILRCCAVQFEEGDVLHWWHPQAGNSPVTGIRTRFSDDPLWLVYACAVYWETTGDRMFFDRKISYLSAAELTEEETDRYFSPKKSELRESVYRHAVRAFRRGLNRGTHGLIRFGAGDWNDGMNNVGSDGETVWGTMFALICTRRLRALSLRMSDLSTAAELEQAETELFAALDRCAYAEDRFIRGYADGVPFGVDETGQTIDLLPQVFAVFAELDRSKQDTALASAYRLLYSKEDRILKLLTPPYQTEENGFPGTIGAYPPGVRENGGQYTHAAVWCALSEFYRGNGAQGVELLDALNPINHCKTERDTALYGAEPYVLCGDVYALSGHVGEGGWSHYTGAAGWYYRTVIEGLFGIRRRGEEITVSPCIPPEWNGCRITMDLSGTRIKLQVERGNEKGVFEQSRRLDCIRLDGGSHEIVVIV